MYKHLSFIANLKSDIFTYMGYFAYSAVVGQSSEVVAVIIVVVVVILSWTID